MGKWQVTHYVNVRARFGVKIVWSYIISLSPSVPAYLFQQDLALLSVDVPSALLCCLGEECSSLAIQILLNNMVLVKSLQATPDWLHLFGDQIYWKILKTYARKLNECKTSVLLCVPKKTAFNGHNTKWKLFHDNVYWSKLIFLLKLFLSMWTYSVDHLKLFQDPVPKLSQIVSICCLGDSMGVAGVARNWCWLFRWCSKYVCMIQWAVR